MPVLCLNSVGKGPKRTNSNLRICGFFEALSEVVGWHERPNCAHNPIQTVLQPASDKLGINRKGRRVGLHAFRHTLASMLLQSTGVAVAQRQLRHSDASTTLGHYGHILGNDHREAVEQIESALSGTTGSA